MMVKKGDIVRLETSGGGGFGDPKMRAANWSSAMCDSAMSARRPRFELRPPRTGTVLLKGMSVWVVMLDGTRPECACRPSSSLMRAPAPRRSVAAARRRGLGEDHIRSRRRRHRLAQSAQ